MEWRATASGAMRNHECRVGCVLIAVAIFSMAAGALLLAQQAPIPAPNELPGQPFAIKKTWVIGGLGNWDYLTLDPAARELFVTHQTKVQVVDVDSGTIAGEVTGFGEARAVVVDPNGQTGYVTDARANLIRIFDRRTFQLLGKIPVASSPRALVFEPQTGMLFAFGALPTPAPPPRQNRPTTREDLDPCSVYAGGSPPPPAYHSLISVIDPGKRNHVADIQVCGILGAAQADGAGKVYFTIANFNEVGQLNAPAIVDLAQHPGSQKLQAVDGSVAADGSLLLNFNRFATMGWGSQFSVFRLGQECQEPRAVAVDSSHSRLFAACTNMKLKVLAMDTGASLAALTIGPGVDAMGYDPSRGLIFTANGGGYGSVTIIRQHLTDSYTVIQNLPTMQQARTIAIDPSTGLVYLVTTLYGAKLDHPPVNGIGTLKLSPVDGSFQVLVIGN
jgi:DNA-binding beta-propeller fold protein YncE